MQEKGDEESWNVMLDRFMNEQNAQEKRKLLSGLGNYTNFGLFFQITNNSLI